MTQPDFKQPSTWRGLLGLIALAGFALNPELLEQIAIALGAGFSIIEMVRNEWRN
jgi:hypothetical protein